MVVVKILHDTAEEKKVTLHRRHRREKRERWGVREFVTTRSKKL